MKLWSTHDGLELSGVWGCREECGLQPIFCWNSTPGHPTLGLLED